MVAVVTGTGLGVERGSGYVLGSKGQLGDAAFGRYGENVTVNAATGNLNITRTDEILIGQGLTTDLVRNYNSLGPATDDNQDNWAIGNARQITGLTGTLDTAGSTITRIDWDGSDTVYTYDTTSGLYIGKQGTGAYDTLSFAANKWTWTDGTTGDVEVYKLASNPNNPNDAYWARLASTTDPDGDSETYTWTGNMLTQVTSSSGETIALNYAGSNLASLTTTLADGTIVDRTIYTYDTSNRLSTVTTDLTPNDDSIADGNVVVTTYTYDHASDRVASITQTGGASLVIAYDSANRVASFTQTDAAGVTSKTTLSYDTVNNATTVTDALGNATKMTYDAATGLLKRIDYPPAVSGAAPESASFIYDGNGNVLTATDGLGNVTTYAYDGNGNMTLMRTATGDTTAWLYDAFNEVVTKTQYFVPDPDGNGNGKPSQPVTTRYAYDTDHNLRYVVSAMGEVTEYQWSGSQQVSSIVYRGVTYDISQLVPTDTISETKLNNWLAGISDKSGAIRTDTRYDFRGLVNRVQTYGNTLADGTGDLSSTFTRVSYAYDQSGNLLARRTSGLNGDTFVHDGLGRLISAVDLDAGTTTYAFNDGANTTTLTMAGGAQTVSTYNLAGQLIQTQTTGGDVAAATVAYAYDKDGNLRMVTDADGNRSYIVYDALNRKIADIAADGAIVEYRYDAADRVIATIHYVNKVTAFTSLVDANGNPKAVALSTILPAASANDRYRWNVYDAMGRVVETLDSEGDAASYAYDGRSDVVTATDYANVVSAATVTSLESAPPTSTVLPATDAKRDETVRSFYDDDGRLIGTFDATNHLTQIFYDEAGEKVETIAYADTGTWHSSFTTTLGTVTPGASDIATRYFYDGRGLLVYTLDNTLQPTEYDYDVVGRLIATYQYGGPIGSKNTGGYTADYIAGQIAVLDLATNPATKSSWNVYNAAGHLAESVDSDGDVVTYSYDGNGNRVASKTYANVLTQATLTGFRTTPPTSFVLPTADSTRDDYTRYFYDSLGRETGALDAKGYLTQTIYDANGLKTDSIAYAGPTATSQRASGSFAQLLGSITLQPANDVHTRYFYDADNRLQYTVDSGLNVVELDYDGQGNVLNTIAYGAPIASTRNWSTAYVASQISTLNLIANAATRIGADVYDSDGRLAYAIDPTGYVVANGYDGQGHVIKRVAYAAAHAVGTTDYTQAQWDNWANNQSGNANNRTDRFFYDAMGRQIYQVDPLGYVDMTQYDFAGRVTLQVRYADPYAVTDAVTDMTTVLPGTIPSTAVQHSFVYDTLGRATDSYDGMGIRTHNTYDALGHLLTATVAYNTSDAATSSYDYDSLGRLSSTTDAMGGVTSRTYDGQGNTLTTTDADGNVTTYAYDQLGQAITATDATNAVTHYQYDAFGNVILATDANGGKFYSFYDDNDRLALTIDGELYATGYTYDAFGDAIAATQYAGKVTGTITAGVLPTVPTGASDITTYAFFDNSGRKVLDVDGAGYATKTTYDAFDGVVTAVHYANAITDPITPGAMPTITANGAHDEKTQFARDGLGEVTLETDATTYTEAFVYDAFGGRTSMTNELGGVTTSTYDKNGNLLTATLAETSVASDGTVEATSVLTKYAYDKRGNKVSMIEAYGLAEGRTTTWAYDLDDRLTVTSGNAVVWVDSVTYTWQSNTAPLTTNTYDAAGNLIEQVDPNGAQTFFYYDGANRKIAQLNAVGTLSTWTYDGVGNVKSERVYGVAFAMPPAPGGNPPSTNSTNYRETTYTYYKNNRLKTTTVANVLNWQYGATTPVASNAVVTDYYDAFGNMILQTDARGNNSWFFYDDRGNKVAQVDQELYLTTYTLDLDGNVLNETRYATKLGAAPSSNPPATAVPAGTSDPAHDRITNFTYDRMGRRLTEQRMGVAISTVNASNGALSTATGSSTVKYQYNGLGEVTQKTEATGDATTYAYDSMGRQTSIATASFTDVDNHSVATTTTMTYDGINDLTSSTENGTRVTTYAYQRNGHMTQMTDADGNTTTYGYDLAGNQMFVSHLRSSSSGATVKEATLYSYDALGRVVGQELATWRSSAWVAGDTQNMQYDAWGDVVAKGANGGYQEFFTYDNAGNLTSTNSGDGTTKFYFYDLDGKQTAEVTTDGGALGGGLHWSNISETQLISQITNGNAAAVGAYDAQGIVLTFNTYDKRGLQLSTIEPFRDLATGSASATITSSQTYDAFGEVLTQTNARGYTTTYTYNTMGNVTSTALPAVAAYDEHGNAILDASGHNVRPTSYAYYDASGRLVATRDANGNDAADDNGNLDTRVLLAGSGYDGSDALTVEEFHPDGSAIASYYDVNRDKVKQSANGVVGTGEVDETFTYDAMDRLLSDTHPTRAANTAGNNTGVAQTLIDYYVYDELGERIAHYNNVYGSSVEETTDYDIDGRVTKTADMDGHVTTTAYQWAASAAASGFGDYGGWVKTTVNSSALTETETLGYFGQTVAKTDFGGRNYSYSFDLAGRVVRESNDADPGSPTVTTYYNTGNVAQIVTGYRHGDYDQDYMNTYADEVTSTYSYDKDGNRLYEYYQSDKWTSFYHRTADGDILYTKIGPGEIVLESATATYDEDDRLSTITDSGDEAPMSIAYTYDLNADIRHMSSTFRTLDQYGNVSSGTSTEDYWYKYDAMNRFTTTMGTLSGGTISHGAAGSDITYYRDGTRATMTDATSTETYTYTADGYLARTDIKIGTQSETATYAYDTMARVTDYAETDTTGATVYHRSGIAYDQASLLQNDTVMTKQGGTTTTQTSYYYYTAQGIYQGGVVTDVKTTSTSGGSTTHPETQNFYTWYDSAVQSGIAYQANTNGTTYNTSYAYDGAGHLETVDIEDGRPRTVSFNTDAYGQIMTRDEHSSASANPHEIHYYFNGIQVGDVSNNGTSDTDYAASITAHETANKGGAFRNGSTTALSYQNFDQSYDPVNGNNNQANASSYTVAAGDTLMSIAQAVWGDGSLWYIIADANGLSQSDALAAGETLSIPNKIVNVHNNTSTFKVYDPNDAIGNTTPNTPKPKSHHGGCGILGEILLAVVAVAVTFLTAGAAVAALSPTLSTFGAALGAVATGAATGLSTGAMIAIGAGAAAMGSIVSQGVGLATGLQSSFNWGAVGMAAIGGAVTAGLGGINSEPGAFSSWGTVGGAVARAVTGNVLTQGIGVATGLQKKFDWAGVASAAASAAASSYVGESVPGAANSAQGTPPTFANTVISGTAGMLAGAAARSVANGTDFGDNILAALPGTVSSIVGTWLKSQFMQPQQQAPAPASAPAPGAGAAQGLPTVMPDPRAPLSQAVDYVASPDDGDDSGELDLAKYFDPQKGYTGGYSADQLQQLKWELEYRTQQQGGLSSPADYAALTQAWIRYVIPDGFTEIDSTTDASAAFRAVSLQEQSTGRIFFTAAPLDPSDPNSRQQAIDMGNAPGSSQGAKDMANFVTNVLSNQPTDSYSGVVNVGWSLAGAYAAVAAETEFAKFDNLGPGSVQTVTFGSAPQTPVVAFMESHSAEAPDGRSWSVVNAFLQGTTQDYNFRNDPVYVVDGTAGNAAKLALGVDDAVKTMIPGGLPHSGITDATIAGYRLNDSTNLLFGQNHDLGNYPDWYSTANGRVPAAHMIENYTVTVRGNNFTIPIPDWKGPNPPPVVTPPPKWDTPIKI